MGIFEGILLCTDLDGTLLGPDRTVSPENAAAIEHFKAEGGKFTFVTGRMPCTAEKQYHMVQPNAPFGCGNGAGLYDYENRRYIWSQTLAEGALELARDVLEQIPGMGMQLYTHEQVWFPSDNLYCAGTRQRNDLPLLTCSLRDFREPILRIMLCDAEDKILRVEQILKSHPKAHRFDFVRSEPTLYEILPKGINKGVILPKLAQHLGIRPDRIVAVGDYYNDLPMLRDAGLGIAVANAVPEAKAVADHVTVSNLEHAIARVIGDLESGALKLN